MESFSQPAIEEKLRQGINLARDGDRHGAYLLFDQITRIQPKNEQALVWKATVTDDPQEAITLLEQVLKLNPDNQRARSGLVWARKRLEDSFPVSGPVDIPPFVPLDVAPEPSPVQPESVYTANPAPAVTYRELGSAPPPAPEPTAEIPAPAVPVGEPALQPQPTVRTARTGARPNQTASRIAPVAEPAPPPQEVVATLKLRPGLVLTLGFMLFMQLVIVGLLLFFLLNDRNQNNSQIVGVRTAATEESPTPTPATTTTASATNTSAPTTALTTASTTTVLTTAALTPTAPSATTPPGTTATTRATTTAIPRPPTPTIVPGGSGITNPAMQEIDNMVAAGRSSAESGNYMAAINTINQALRIDGRHVGANFELGLVYLEAPDDKAVGGAHRYDEAIKAFRVVTDQVPTWPGGWIRLGEAQAAKGDVQGAIQSYKRSLELDAGGPERWLALAALYERNNQPAEAAYARQRAQSLKTPTPTPGANR